VDSPDKYGLSPLMIAGKWYVMVVMMVVVMMMVKKGGGEDGGGDSSAYSYSSCDGSGGIDGDR
jgi:hypothetical protein